MTTETKLKTFHEEMPKEGKFVAFYTDGNGADLYQVIDGGFMTAEGDDCDDSPFDDCFYWMPLPDDFKFWYEISEERPSI